MPYADKTKRAANGREYRARPAVIAARKLRRATTVEKAKARERFVRWRYGVLPETYRAMLTEQDGKCAVCRGLNEGRRDWHVDHDHVSGYVRGLLCNQCNLMLGHAADDPDRLRAGARYLDAAILREHSGE